MSRIELSRGIALDGSNLAVALRNAQREVNRIHRRLRVLEKRRRHAAVCPRRLAIDGAAYRRRTRRRR